MDLFGGGGDGEAAEKPAEEADDDDLEISWCLFTPLRTPPPHPLYGTACSMSCAAYTQYKRTTVL